MITVSFCCNDPDNGNFDGHVQSIEIHGIEGCDITLEPRTYPAPKFAWLDDPPKPHDSRETAGFKVARFKFRCALYKSWYGNWCWDAVKMSGVEVLRLFRVLCNEGWSCTEAGVEFAEAWDEGHEKVTKELLSSALRPDEVRESMYINPLHFVLDFMKGTLCHRPVKDLTDHPIPRPTSRNPAPSTR